MPHAGKKPYHGSLLNVGWAIDIDKAAPASINGQPHFQPTPMASEPKSKIRGIPEGDSRLRVRHTPHSAKATHPCTASNRQSQTLPTGFSRHQPRASGLATMAPQAKPAAKPAWRSDVTKPRPTHHAAKARSGRSIRLNWGKRLLNMAAKAGKMAPASSQGWLARK